MPACDKSIAHINALASIARRTFSFWHGALHAMHACKNCMVTGMANVIQLPALATKTGV